jgi:hypothetical protein
MAAKFLVVVSPFGRKQVGAVHAYRAAFASPAIS